MNRNRNRNVIQGRAGREYTAATGGIQRGDPGPAKHQLLHEKYTSGTPRSYSFGARVHAFSLGCVIPFDQGSSSRCAVPRRAHWVRFTLRPACDNNENNTHYTNIGQVYTKPGKVLIVGCNETPPVRHFNVIND